MRGRATYTARSLLLTAAVALIGCTGGQASQSPPGVVDVFGELARGGATLTNVVSGDPGCTDPTLVANAVRFTLVLPGSPPAEIHLFSFNDETALRSASASLDACQAAFASRAGAGDVGGARFDAYAAFGAPWSSQVESALREAITQGPPP